MSAVIKSSTDTWSSEINGTTVKISYGDIFEQPSVKVIAFNEYFDTIVDDLLISSQSLNGILVKKYIGDIDSLNAEIEKQVKEFGFCVSENAQKHRGNKIKCKLGSIVKYGDFLLVAFSHIDDQYRAFLTLEDLYACLHHFWHEIDRVYAGYQVSLPLLGSGLTRIGNIRDEELLIILLESFKNSKIRLHGEGINIVLHHKHKTTINLAFLKKN